MMNAATVHLNAAQKTLCGPHNPPPLCSSAITFSSSLSLPCPSIVSSHLRQLSYLSKSVCAVYLQNNHIDAYHWIVSLLYNVVTTGLASLFFLLLLQFFFVLLAFTLDFPIIHPLLFHSFI